MTTPPPRHHPPASAPLRASCSASGSHPWSLSRRPGARRPWSPAATTWRSTSGPSASRVWARRRPGTWRSQMRRRNGLNCVRKRKPWGLFRTNVDHGNFLQIMVKSGILRFWLWEEEKKLVETNVFFFWFPQSRRVSLELSTAHRGEWICWQLRSYSRLGFREDWAARIQPQLTMNYRTIILYFHVRWE